MCFDAAEHPYEQGARPYGGEQAHHGESHRVEVHRGDPAPEAAGEGEFVGEKGKEFDGADEAGHDA